MSLIKVNRNMPRIVATIMKGCYLGIRNHPDPLLHKTRVSGSYIHEMWKRYPNSQLYWIQEDEYLLLVENGHTYSFNSSVNFGN